MIGKRVFYPSKVQCICAIQEVRVEGSPIEDDNSDGKHRNINQIRSSSNVQGQTRPDSHHLISYQRLHNSHYHQFLILTSDLDQHHHHHLLLLQLQHHHHHHSQHHHINKNHSLHCHRNRNINSSINWSQFLGLEFRVAGAP